jgi:ABC-2 type transport system permease protein
MTATAHAAGGRALPPARGFAELVKVESKLALRVPMGLIVGVVVPVILLVIFSAIPGLKGLAPGSTLTMFDQYVPVLIGLALCVMGLINLPVQMATNRQMGVLRRFATTPAPPSWLLAAQVIINLALVLMAIVILLAGGAVFFGLHMPSQWGGFVLSVLLAIAAMFAIGLAITAVAPSPQIAALAGTILLYPLLFFAGMWTPKQNLSPVMQHIGNYTPLGAAVQAMDAAMQGHFPPTRPLLVMAAYAVVFGVAAIRLFRWE